MLNLLLGAEEVKKLVQSKVFRKEKENVVFGSIYLGADDLNSPELPRILKEHQTALRKDIRALASDHTIEVPNCERILERLTFFSFIARQSVPFFKEHFDNQSTVHNFFKLLRTFSMNALAEEAYASVGQFLMLCTQVTKGTFRL